MFRVGLLFVIFAVVSADETDVTKCERIIEPSVRGCCKANSIASFVNDQRIKDCYVIPFNPKTCEREICVSTKKGLASDEGVINKEGWAESIDTNNVERPELAKVMKEKCVFGDISKYGPPDFCDLIKLGFCMKIQFFAACTEWEDTPQCEGIKDLAIECKNIHDTV